MMMIEDIVNQHCPANWEYQNLANYKTYDLRSSSRQYEQFESHLSGDFNKGIDRIVRVENTYLYGQFLLRKEEYETRGCCTVLQLFHDTAESKVDSILCNNLDWRLAKRVKFGQGVSFSGSPAYANKQSSWSNGTERAMIVADVLVQNTQHVRNSLQLPKEDYDTTVGNKGKVYVKYHDDEFYPTYVIYYESN
ncbi:hypothetical protein RN001_006965 [Aquatica leii]|uniref:Poly [ADP-ribose] polymerase n=1 Tax=Aquatica leii TaxID=1421715 RepID=A0AAN7PJB2_9COLE|nr:hypothetical protein RN001_006965 [Aquatica leii]